MPRSAQLIVAALLAVFCIGCSSERAAETGTFYHRKEADNLYVIGFTGHSSRDGQRVNDFALLLAAEIGRKLGYEYFTVQSRTDKRYQLQVIERSARPSRQDGSIRGGASDAAHGHGGLEIQVLYSKQHPKGSLRGIYNVPETIRYIKARYNISKYNRSPVRQGSFQGVFSQPSSRPFRTNADLRTHARPQLQSSRLLCEDRLFRPDASRPADITTPDAVPAFDRTV